MTLKYGLGKKLHGEPGEIELVASELGEQETDWYVEKFGGGVMAREPKVFGSLLISADQLGGYADLQFVARDTGL